MLVKVFPYKVWDINIGDYINRTNLGTKEAIGAIGGVIINADEILVDSSNLNGNGFTLD